MLGYIESFPQPLLERWFGMPAPLFCEHVSNQIYYDLMPIEFEPHPIDSFDKLHLDLLEIRDRDQDPSRFAKNCFKYLSIHILAGLQPWYEGCISRMVQGVDCAQVIALRL